MRTLRVAAAALLFAVPALMSAAQEGGTTDAMEASLAAGWKACDVAREFGVSESRVSHLRDEFLRDWRDFQS